MHLFLQIMESIHNKVIKAVTELTAIEKTEPEKITLPPRHTSFDWEQISAHGVSGGRDEDMDDVLREGRAV